MFDHPEGLLVVRNGSSWGFFAKGGVCFSKLGVYPLARDVGDANWCLQDETGSYDR